MTLPVRYQRLAELLLANLDDEVVADVLLELGNSATKNVGVPGGVAGLDTSGLVSYGQIAPFVLVPPPTGVFLTDWTNVTAALAAGRVVVFQAGTYVLYNVLVPNQRRLIIPPGCTIKLPDNYATGASSYRIFTATTPGTDITFEGGGTIDGNRRGGNHGLSENIMGIDLSDALRVRVDGLTFYNWRGEGCLFGHVSTSPEKVQITRNYFLDCGVKESGDSANARQGVAFTSGKDLTITGNVFDTIGGYGVDLEGNGASDTFDNCLIADNLYRACAQGFVNVIQGSGAAVPTNIDIRDRIGNGSLGLSGTRVKPTSLQNIQEKFRITGDLALAPGDSAVHDVPTIGDLTLKGVRAGDWIEVGVNGTWGSESGFKNLDVASIVSSAVVNYWGSRSATLGVGVSTWRGDPTTLSRISGAVRRQVTTSDIASDGTLTLRLRYSSQSANNITLFAGTLPLQVWATNHGATP